MGENNTEVFTEGNPVLHQFLLTQTGRPTYPFYE